jgi:hypothetical protein
LPEQNRFDKLKRQFGEQPACPPCRLSRGRRPYSPRQNSVFASLVRMREGVLLGKSP